MYSISTEKKTIDMGFHDVVTVNVHYLYHNGNIVATFNEGYIGEAIRCCNMLNKGD